jgi:hypothetical protein
MLHAWQKNSKYQYFSFKVDLNGGQTTICHTQGKHANNFTSKAGRQLRREKRKF